MPMKEVSIIGAGLSGLSLCLFLAKHNITSKIYELRPANTTSEGAVMLSPNALRTLDILGLYARIKSKGYHFRDLSFNNNDHETLDTYEMGNADKFGYDALRVYRQVLLDELKAMIAEAGNDKIEILYEKKFSHIVSSTTTANDNNNNITFALTDGSTHTTPLLLGADGIHSTLRAHLAPTAAQPTFSSFLAITFPLSSSHLILPPTPTPYPLPVSISHPLGGAFVLAPQNPTATDLLAGTQIRTHDRPRSEWDAFLRNKDLLYKTHLRGPHNDKYNSWNALIKSALDACPLEKLSLWPFYTVPKIPRWFSEEDGGRVVILGDAAHAIPPAAGQGVCQAFEDVHSLALALAAANEGVVEWTEGLGWWQEYRQGRVERTQGLTDEMNRRRMPGWSGMGAERMDSSWLFGVDVEGDVKRYIDGQKGR
ncbi:hypothetical protein M409DRAFT_16454 [Zasmidium cellare ATCC 36951]|uniref:FAD-binding domain-containing protein n=1 Tax=Zasmidium cellare ATCC 36951 TaxID=1080233 RepID=A0A6A6D438_ZASCE|nr:uncharacterized protein M409DRAFT_16454 [Zasmidium cellare ATCC 36951]KAF2174184.1 hypothetical protein M409DRAFT_16454 [Zasmidium cellare ATCC 36951]